MAPQARIWWLAALSALSLPTALGAVHSQLAAVPHGWSRVASTNVKELATFTIALNHEFEGLEGKLLDVSSPDSPNYGKFLTKKEVEELFPPPEDAAHKVVEWLKRHGIKHYRIDRGFVDFATEIETANTLLGASYQLYHNSGVSKLRTLQYSIPDDLQKAVAFVDPGTFFGRLPAAPTVLAPSRTKRARRDSPSNTTVAASCQTSITPPCLKQMYNLGDYVPDPEAGSRLGFGSFLNQSALYADLEKFEEAFDIPSQNFTKVVIANGTTDQDPKHGGYGEANLDVQNLIGLAHPLPVTEFLTGGSPPFIPTVGQPTEADNNNEPYVPYYRYLLSQENEDIPQVISNSYGDQEDGVPLDYAKLTCNLVGLLGLRGITTIFSSGDGGVGGGCLAPDFKTPEFVAIFPATCPYVTAIGGTQAVTPEVAWNLSSGGFSNYFPRPSWQHGAIEAYLDEHVSDETREYYGQYTNFSGRGFPDVAAHSLDPNFDIMYNGEFGDSGGTSASAPVWAAVVGLLNDARLREGKSVLGWLNPLIYQVAKDALVDVTGGYAVGCLTAEAPGYIPGARWNATTGWDPTTGYGLPDFQKLKELVLKL